MKNAVESLNPVQGGFRAHLTCGAPATANVRSHALRGNVELQRAGGGLQRHGSASVMNKPARPAGTEILASDGDEGVTASRDLAERLSAARLPFQFARRSAGVG